VLGLEPHMPHPVFDINGDEPPEWMDLEHREDWRHSRAIREELEDALVEKRRAARGKAEFPPAA